MKIAILLYPEFTGLDAIGPYEMLAHVPGNEVIFVAREKGIITADTGSLKIEATHSIDDVESCDILLIPGGQGEVAVRDDAATIAWIQKMHKGTQYTTSVCSGALLLAAAGLLEGLTATTHWAAQKHLEAYGVTYKAERWVQEGKIITAAGVSAGIDMALYLTSEIQGDDVAKMIQLATEYDPQPPFDSGSVAKSDPVTVKTLGALFDAYRTVA